MERSERVEQFKQEIAQMGVKDPAAARGARRRSTGPRPRDAGIGVKHGPSRGDSCGSGWRRVGGHLSRIMQRT